MCRGRSWRGSMPGRAVRCWSAIPWASVQWCGSRRRPRPRPRPPGARGSLSLAGMPARPTRETRCVPGDGTAPDAKTRALTRGEPSLTGMKPSPARGNASSMGRNRARASGKRLIGRGRCVIHRGEERPEELRTLFARGGRHPGERGLPHVDEAFPPASHERFPPDSPQLWSSPSRRGE
jgi:hypothetical protein